MESAALPEAFLALARLIDDPVFVWRPTGQMLWVNAAFERETGMKVEDFAFRNADNPFIHPEDLPAVLAAIEAFLASSDALSPPIANRFFDAWGKPLSLLSRLHKLDWQGELALLSVCKIAGTSATTAEPTDYRTLVEMADDGILRLAADGRLTYANRSFSEVTGLSQVELRKRRLAELFVAGDRPAVERGLASALASSSASVTGWLESGPRLDVKLSRLETDDPAMVLLAIARDVTAQERVERAEHQSAENERRLRFLTDTVPTIMLYQLVVDENQRRRFTYVSAGVERLHGLSPEAVLADADLLYQQIHEDDLPRVMEGERVSMQDCSTFSVEVRIDGKHGRRWALLRSLPRCQPDGTTIWEGVEIDITSAKREEQERQRLEESLRQAQKMESVGRLAGGVAHDFNNMLTAIRGNIEVARLDLKGNEHVLDALDQASRAADSASNLTRQLLTFSRRQVIAPQVLDLNEVVQRVCQMLMRMLGEDVTIELSLGQPLGNVQMDPGQLEQALVNLAVNARDAMPTGGKLTLTTRDVVLNAAQAAQLQLAAGPFVTLSACDDGVGMSAEVKAQLFEPFFTTKGSGQGTGLGLSMVYGAVRQAGGGIEVESEPGRGATFTLYLPRHAGAPAARADAKPTLSTGGSETIWVVEDEHVVRTLVQNILRRQGYTVQVFDGPSAALAAAASDTPCHLLLTDMVMPEMNGRELAERLHELRPGLKVMFMSGYTEDMVVLRGLQSHDVELIEKPFTVQELSRRVRAALDAR